MRACLTFPIFSILLRICFLLPFICFSSLVYAQSYIFWTDYQTDSIYRADIDGSSKTRILGSLNNPIGIAVDEVNRHIYYINNGADEINRVDLDGSNATTLVSSGIGNAKCIALDVSGGKMYWSDITNESIKRSDLNGSNVETVISTAEADPTGLALDLVNDKIYWTEGGTGYIRRADLVGTNQENLIISGVTDPYGIALDVTNNNMYWMDKGSDYIGTSKLDGSSPDYQLVDLLNAGTPRDLKIDLINDKLFWPDSAGDKIYMCDTDGTNRVDVLSNIPDCRVISLYNVGPHTTFSGTGNWSSSERWSNGIPNSSNKDVIIDGNCTFDDDYTVKDLGVKTGASVTLNSSTELTISGGLTNCAESSAFKLESDASHTASLILNESCNDSLMVERNMKGASIGWHLVGVPVGGQNIDELVKNSANSISVNGSQYGLGVYNESDDSWTTYTTATAPSAGSLQAGKGYEIMRLSDGDMSFSGTPTTEQVDVGVTKNGNGWNLLGNPYTCALFTNSNADATNNFITHNSSALDDSFEAIYIWNPNTGQYEIVNQSSDASYIPSGQGFFVKAAETGTVSFKPDMRTHQTSASFKSDSSIPKIILKASNGGEVKITEFRFIDGASIGLDPGFDAGMFNTDESEFTLYSKLMSDNGVKYALQCLPSSNYDSNVIPIAFFATSNIIEFSIIISDFPDNLSVYIEDRLNNSFINLTEDELFSTEVDIGEINSRFYLHTSTQSLNNIELNKGVNFEILPNSKNSTIFIKGDLSNIELLQIFDVSGRLVFVSENIDNEIRMPTLTDGLLIFRLIGEDLDYSQKINWIN